MMKYQKGKKGYHSFMPHGKLTEKNRIAADYHDSLFTFYKKFLKLWQTTSN